MLLTDSANDVTPTASKTEGTTVNINAVNNVISFKINSFTKISFIRTFKTNGNPSNIYQYKFEVYRDQDKTNLLRTFVVTYTLGNNYNDLLWKYELNNSASCFSLEAVNNTLYEDVSTYSLTDDNGAEYVVNPISSLKRYNIA